ncbi:MAG: altronate hydrolase [Promethearchaeota archaeon]|nr:MAG: altronate hydrolase [Candidatus Lokiarchaeota archaeon]
MKNKFIIMNSEDNCATTLTDVPKDEELQINGGKIIKLNQDISMGHKFALRDINKGELIRKYGEIIGIATEDVKPGDWIHTHNIKSHYLEMVGNE